MVAKDTSYGSETHRPYLDIERIINVQSACSVNRGHDQDLQDMIKVEILRHNWSENLCLREFRDRGLCFCS